MSQRAALPTEAMSFTPGYPWRLDLDVKFDNERPSDWPAWRVRMHVWSGDLRFSLTNGSGVSFETIDDVPGGPATVPVVAMTAAQTESLRATTAPINYVIDLKPPVGDVEDYFAGAMLRRSSPPADLLT